MRLNGRQAILYGTLVVGTLDALDALVFFGLRGVRPIRIFQSIAGGLLGRASFRGGLPTALLGAVLHYLIACGIVVTYYVVSRHVRLLTSQPIVCGLLYGLVAYCVMNFVVLPLSNAGPPSFATPILVNGLLIHAFGIGLPSALFARAAAVRRDPRSGGFP